MGEGDGGGGLLVAPVEERAVLGVWWNVWEERAQELGVFWEVEERAEW